MVHGFVSGGDHPCDCFMQVLEGASGCLGGGRCGAVPQLPVGAVSCEGCGCHLCRQKMEQMGPRRTRAGKCLDTLLCFHVCGVAALDTLHFSSIQIPAAISIASCTVKRTRFAHSNSIRGIVFAGLLSCRPWSAPDMTQHGFVVSASALGIKPKQSCRGPASAGWYRTLGF